LEKMGLCKICWATNGRVLSTGTPLERGGLAREVGFEGQTTRGYLVHLSFIIKKCSKQS